eukprot:COSAG01_NODE_76189_length_189_cov_18.511111_1_plen_51_part_10
MWRGPILIGLRAPKLSAWPRRPAGPYPQYVDDGQLALGVALVMIPARCFLQ